MARNNIPQHLMVLKSIFDLFSKNIVEGKCNNLTEEEGLRIIQTLSHLVRKDDRKSRTEMEKELNMTTSTFYRRKKAGLIPEGIKEAGKAPYWISDNNCNFK